MKRTRILLLLFTIQIVLFSSATAQTPKDTTGLRPVTLEDIWLKYSFIPKNIPGLHSMKDGIHYCSDEDGNIEEYSYETGQKTKTIVFGTDLSSQNNGLSIDFTDYSFSDDETKILFTSNPEPIYRHSFIASNWVWDLKSNKLIPIGKNQKQQLASFSPDGSKVAYVRNNNLFFFDLSTQKEIQITFDGEKNKIINGAPDWVYEEEFSFSKGFEWSPDSKKIAFMRFDESAVKEFTMQIYRGLYPETETFKYPKAGEDNSIVTVWIYNLSGKGSKKTIKVNTGKETDQYIPRIKWTTNPEILCITRLNRLQNKLELLFANAANGSTEIVFSEENKYYIDITDNQYFTADGKFFTWTSESDGYNHIYLFDIVNRKMNQVTKGKWDVVSIYGVDETAKLIYYQSAENGAIVRDVYSISFDGTKKTRISLQNGTNSADFSATFKYYILTHEDANHPPVISLFDISGKLIRVLEDNKALTDALSKCQVSPVEFFTFKTSENVELNGWMIKPLNFDPKKKYPLFMTAYGGPGANTVNDEWSYSSLWYQHLASQGYIIASVDNRGTGYRGEEFKKSTYLQLGRLECIDQTEAAKYLGRLPYIDSTRIGIQGWSFGGYLSSLCILKSADVFKMAIAVAPVTNWKYYDNIYTERFLRKPSDNQTGYETNSPINFVNNLKGKFLLIHGSADDNVHFQNTMEFAKALNDANKQFDMHIYPNKNHGIYGGRTRLQLFTLMTNFILENL